MSIGSGPQATSLQSVRCHLTTRTIQNFWHIMGNTGWTRNLNTEIFKKNTFLLSKKSTFKYAVGTQLLHKLILLGLILLVPVQNLRHKLLCCLSLQVQIPFPVLPILWYRYEQSPFIFLLFFFPLTFFNHLWNSSSLVPCHFLSGLPDNHLTCFFFSIHPESLTSPSTSIQWPSLVLL